MTHISTTTFILLVVQEAFVIADKHLWFNLFHSLQDNSNNNDDGSTTEGYVCTEYSIEEERNNRNDNQAYCTYKYNII